MKWNAELKDSQATNLFSQGGLDYQFDYVFEPDELLIGSVNKKTTLFYFYCYNLKSFYWSEQFGNARALLKLLKKKYPIDWLKNEKGIAPMMTKLAIPEIVLKILKKVKKLK
jgi:hypothetical protein